MAAMRKIYGDRAEQVFYASRNKGVIKGVERKKKHRPVKAKMH